MERVIKPSAKIHPIGYVVRWQAGWGLTQRRLNTSSPCVSERRNAEESREESTHTACERFQWSGIGMDGGHADPSDERGHPAGSVVRREGSRPYIAITMHPKRTLDLPLILYARSAKKA
jgi:hypothetical protein